jgi:rsbT co-antagonist protein RsbR
MPSPVEQRVVAAFLERLDENVTESCRRVALAEIGFYKNLPPASVVGSFKRAFEATMADIGLVEPKSFPALLSALGAQRSRSSVILSDILRGMALGFEVASEFFAARFQDDLEARIVWERSRSRISYNGAAALADAYVQAREKVVTEQADEIVRLSIRVLPLYPGILVLPLVGRIDNARADTMTLSLLEAVVANSSKVVLIDVTGLPFVDAAMAAHLLATAQAAALIGAKPILVGMNSTMARTMIESGVELGNLKTLSNLSAGLQHALHLLGKTIVDQ